MIGSKNTFRAAAVAVGMLAGVSANALTFNGGEFNVVVSNVSGATGTFTYTANFTNWTGAANYITAIDFGLSNPKIVSIDQFSTTATGGWTAEIGSSSANGCGGGSSVFACANDDPFTEADGQRTLGTITWVFDITFDSNLIAANWTDTDNHIGAFFQTCTDTNNGRRCNPGTGLSQETTFSSSGSGGGSSGGQVPEPGTLTLLGLGLLGLGFGRRVVKSK